MDIGIVHFTGSGVLPQDLARAVEERGFESLFYTEHTHIPVATRRADGTAARHLATTFDPFVALAAAAAVTSTLRLGTAVCLVTQRDPITTAKEVASLDQVAGGRLLFGVGAGWNRAELANHGVVAGARMARMGEAVQAMRAIWSQEQAEHHGDQVDFGPLWSWPKPAQPGGPPVLVGGNGPGAEDRVLAVGDGWIPQCGHLANVDELRERVARLRRRGEEAGRPHLPITLFGVPADPALLGQVAAAGVDRCLLPVRSEDGDEVLAAVDALTPLLSL